MKFNRMTLNDLRDSIGGTTSASATLLLVVSILLLATPTSSQATGFVYEYFDKDPGWDAHNNELTDPTPRIVTQDFGYRTSHHAGSVAGEIGGTVDHAPFETASYAQVLAPFDLEQSLNFSGNLSLHQASATSGFTSMGNIFIGFFNSQEQGWRPPNFLGFQLRGHNEPVPNVASLELSYGTSAWEADGIDWGQAVMPDGAQHHFDLSYDHNVGDGRITLDWDRNEIIELNVRPEHRAHGASFNRFGIFSMELPGVHAGNATEAYFDDLTINGAFHDFSQNPNWLGVGNHKTFADPVLYGMNNFGFRSTNVAGESPGELGGWAWRVEHSDEQFQAYYAKDVGTLSLEDKLFARGKIAFEKFSTDAGVMLGWFDSTEQDWPPSNFVGVYMDSLSDIGRFFTPMYGTATNRTNFAADPWLLLRPDATSMEWIIYYDPDAVDGRGAITISLGGLARTLVLDTGDKQEGANLDRFGLFNMQDNNGKHSVVYLDDLVFTTNRTTTSCDFNGDAGCDLSDIHRMFEQGNLLVGVATGLLTEQFDLVDDNVLNQLDIDAWLSKVAAENGYSSAYLRGDTDLDRDVDLADYNALADNFDPDGAGASTPWRHGNSDGDNDVDLSDYNALAGNFHPGGYGTAAVPEPGTALLALLGMLLVSVFDNLEPYPPQRQQSARQQEHAGRFRDKV